jgi:hypothetical protein
MMLTHALGEPPTTAVMIGVNSPPFFRQVEQRFGASKPHRARSPLGLHLFCRPTDSKRMQRDDVKE